MKSLQNQLLGGIAVCTVLAWTLMSISNYQLERQQLREEFDIELRESAYSLLAILQSEVDPTHLGAPLKRSVPVEHSTNQRRDFWSIRVTYQGQKTYQSGAPLPFPKTPITDGFGQLQFANAAWRYFTVEQKAWRISVAEPIAHRDEIIHRSAIDSLASILFFLPLCLFGCYFAIRLSLRDVNHLALELTKRKPGELECIQLKSPSLEIRPVIAELNSLFEQLSAALERESSFSANAAHELRTPLAAIRTQVEVAMASPEEPRRHALSKVLQAVDQLTHLLNQLLRLARIEQDRSLDLQLVNIYELCEDIIQDSQARTADKQIRLHYPSPSQLHWPVNEASIRMAIDNLLRNALRYAKSTIEVQLLFVAETDQLQISIQDDGPGLSSEHTRKISRRFYRANDAKGSGSGLGLAIVERIVSLHGGQLEFDAAAEHSGLRAKITLPR